MIALTCLYMQNMIHWIRKGFGLLPRARTRTPTNLAQRSNGAVNYPKVRSILRMFFQQVLVGSGFAGLAGVYYLYRQLELEKEKLNRQLELEKEKSPEVREDKIMKQIKEAEISHSWLPNPHVPRPEDEQHLINMGTNERGSHTILLVYGSRGIGKSTLAVSAFRKCKSVLYASPSKFDLNAVCSALLNSAGIKLAPDDYGPCLALEKYLTEYERRGNEYPYLVVDVHAGWTPKELTELLEWAKIISPDKCVANIILVFSQVLSTYSDSISFGIYRSLYHEVQEPSNEEFKQYVELNLEKLGCVDEVVRERISSFAIGKTGKNFIFFKSLFVDIRRRKQELTEKLFLSIFEREYQTSCEEHKNVTDAILVNLQYKRGGPKKQLLEELCKGKSIQIKKFLSTFQIKIADLHKISNSERPHPLMFSRDQTLRLTNKLFCDALKMSLDDI